jgi:predicted aspartyl protease
LATARTDFTKSCRLHIFDKTTNLKFLIDTGADVSAVPPKQNDKANCSNLSLYAANNAIIKTYGTKQIKVELGLRRNFLWNFYVADVSGPIIGADFLKHYGLIPDLRSRELIDSTTVNIRRNFSQSRV